MTFVLDALSDKPVGLYNGDSGSPFTDLSSYGGTATYSGGTPVQHSALVKGASFAPVFNNTVTATWACPVFRKGQESQAFSISAWAKAGINYGYPAPATVTNLETVPQPGATGNYNGSTNGWGTTPTGTNFANGGFFNLPYKRYTATSAFTPASQAVIMLQQMSLPGLTTQGSLAVNPGETYNISVYVKSSIAQTVFPMAVWLNSAGAGTGSNNGSDVTLPTNVWTRINVSGTAPAATVALRIDIRAGNSTRLAWAINDTFDISSAQITSGTALYPYQDGSMYGYLWNGTTNASSSSTDGTVSAKNLVASNSHLATGTGTAIPNGRIGTTHTQSAIVTGAPDGGAFQRYTATGTATTPTASADFLNFSPLTPSIYPTWTGGAAAVTVGRTYMASIYVRSSVTQQVRIQGIFIKYLNGGTITGASGTANGPDVTLAPNVWTRLNLAVTAGSDAVTLRLDVDFGNTPVSWGTAGMTFDASMAMIQETNTLNQYFDGGTPGAVWDGTVNGSMSSMLVQSSDQKVLSHTDQYDGIVINGNTVKFITTYSTAPAAVCSYDIQESRAVQVTGVHTATKNSLYVDDALVAEQVLTDVQQADTFATNVTNLTTGTTTSSQQVAIDGVAFYSTALTPDVITRQFNTGRLLPQPEDAVPTYGGDFIPLSISNSDVFLDQWIQTAEDWNTGLFDNTAVVNDVLVPTFDATATSVPSVWYKAISLESSNVSTIYGVQLNWVGTGATVDVSLDGVTWETVARGKNCATVPSGTSTTNAILQVRITFPGGIINDTSYIDNLNIIGFKSAAARQVAGRTVTNTLAYPERDYDFTKYHENYGTQIDPGGTVVISSDALDATPARTIELLIKRNGPTNPTISMSGVTYVNGVEGTTTLPSAVWVLMHIVAPTNVTGNITITGPAQVGYVGIYDTALSADTIRSIYGSYVGVSPVVTYAWTGTANASSSTATSKVTTITNLEQNPITDSTGSWNTHSGGWGSPLPAVTNPSTGGPTNGPYKRATAAAAFTPPVQQYFYLQQKAIAGTTSALASIGINAGEIYTLSAYVRSSIAQVIVIWGTMLDTNSVGTQWAQSTDLALTPNTWQRVSITTLAAPVNTKALRLDIRSGNSSTVAWSIGDTLDVANAMITQTGSLYDYFDGNTASQALFADNSVINVSESATAANIYQHDWSITASG